MDEKTVKKMEKCNEDACELLAEIEFKDEKDMIETIELVSRLLFQINYPSDKENKN